MAILTSLLLVCVFSVMCSEAGILPNISLPFPFIGPTGNNTEHGNLAGIGRNLVQKVKETFDGVVSSLPLPQGLDTDKTRFSPIIDVFKKQLQAIYPGTRWCGDGNQAQSETDFGIFKKTDQCCRDHDNCPDNIEKGGSKYNLINNGLFTRSHCLCDEKFYKCLKESDDIYGGIGLQIGTTYFTILGPQCFKKEYPIVKCIKHKGLTNRCVQYAFDVRAEKIYQWFDNPEYLGTCHYMN